MTPADLAPSGRVQRNGDESNSGDEDPGVYQTFHEAGNPYADSNNLADISNLETDYEFNIPGLDITRTGVFEEEGDPHEVQFLGTDFTANVHHIGERHTLPFFQFEIKSVNTFFDDVDDADSLRAKVWSVAGSEIVPKVRDAIEEVDDLGTDWPDLSAMGEAGDYYLHYAMSTQDHDGDEDVQDVSVSITSIAPAVGGASFTRSQLEDFVASKE